MVFLAIATHTTVASGNFHFKEKLQKNAKIKENIQSLRINAVKGALVSSDLFPFLSPTLQAGNTHA